MVQPNSSLQVTARPYRKVREKRNSVPAVIEVDEEQTRAKKARKVKAREKRAREKEVEERQRSAMEDLWDRIGHLETREEFLEAMEYCESGVGVEEDKFRYTVFKRYIAEYCFWEQTWEEYAVFQLLDEIPRYFIPDGDINLGMLYELANIAKLYVAVAGRNALSLLDDPFEGEAIAHSGGTNAEKFKAHLERHRVSLRFKVWTVKHLKSARSAVYQAVKDSRRQPESGVGAAGPRYGDLGRSFAISQAPRAHAATSDSAEPTPEPIIASNSIHQRANTGALRNEGSEGNRRSQIAPSASPPYHLNLRNLPEKIEDELVYLKVFLGDMKKCKEIRRASEYMDKVRDNGPASTEAEAFEVFLNTNTNIDKQRMDWEIEFYRLTGETPSTIIDPGHGAEHERALLEDLVLLAQRWISLSASGELGELEKTTLVKEATQKGFSPGKILNAYLADYQRQEGVTEWTKQDMSNVRCQVVEVWNKVHNERRELERKRGASEVVEGASSLKKIKSSKAQQSFSQRQSKGKAIRRTLKKNIKPRAEMSTPDLYGDD